MIIHTFKRGDLRTDEAESGDKSAKLFLLRLFFFFNCALPSESSTWCSFSVVVESPLMDVSGAGAGADEEIKADSPGSTVVRTKLSV